MYTFLILIMGCYAVMMVVFATGFSRLKRKILIPEGASDALPSVSVIIPFRNDMASMRRLLQRLQHQSADKKSFEVIIVDDHSDDIPPDAFTDIEMAYAFTYVPLNSEPPGYGKKEAITAGINKAKSPVILLTDADTIPEDHWISVTSAFFVDSGCRMVAGMVKVANPCNWAGGFEALDFYGLIGASAGAAGISTPFMCNGANLAFLRDDFISVGGYDGNAGISSGDDVFLLHKFLRKYGDASIRWNMIQGACTSVEPAASVQAFFQQRFRWASKSRHYRNPMAIGVATVVLLANLSLLTGVFLSFLVADPGIAITLFSVKALADFPIILMVVRHFRQQSLMAWYLPATLLYPFYTAVIGILSFFRRPRWKGRKIR